MNKCINWTYWCSTDMPEWHVYIITSHRFMWDIINHSWHNLNGVLSKASFKDGHGWLITSHGFMQTRFIFHALSTMLEQLLMKGAPGRWVKVLTVPPIIAPGNVGRWIPATDCTGQAFILGDCRVCTRTWYSVVDGYWTSVYNNVAHDEYFNGVAMWLC